MYLYEITNTVNGMGYVGITKGRIKHRWWSHKKDLRTGKHGNKWLQAAYDKYGPLVFEYNIRQKCDSLEELSVLEKDVIKNEKYRLYNIKEGGYDAPPVVHTEDAKRKISEASKVPVIGMSINTGEIREYLCGKDTAKDGFNPKNIGKCCKLSTSYASGRVQQAISTGKWVWMYKDEFNLEEMNRRRLMAISRGNNDQSRSVMGKSLTDGTLVEFTSVSSAARALDGSQQTIGKICLGGENKTHKGYVWVYSDIDQPTILLEERYVYAIKKFKNRHPKTAKNR